MMGSSLCRTIGGLFLCLVCLVLVGCGGGSNIDALVKEQKDIVAEATANKGDPTKVGETMKKQMELGKKIMKLSEADQKAYAEALKKAGVTPPGP
jgi:hypothetical protein